MYVMYYNIFTIYTKIMPLKYISCISNKGETGVSNTTLIQYLTK